MTESSVQGNGPADVFQIPGAKGTLGFISQMSECFCDRCNRMRLSADGWLRPCLLNEMGQIEERAWKSFNKQSKNGKINITAGGKEEAFFMLERQILNEEKDL